MAKYEIKYVVCDYGLYEDGKLKLILGSEKNAHIIKRILEIDGSVLNVATDANVVEVVRCKDCIHCNQKPYTRCRRDNLWHDGDDFCSYGERGRKIMAYIDTKYIGECKTCRHHKNRGCDTWCDHGESYQPNTSKIPAADVVEVVRCKDCKYYRLYHCACVHPGFNGVINVDGFCSYGERKT